jgi:dTDP-4-amino-4,6-dideoxygalactose transaminase
MSSTIQVPLIDLRAHYEPIRHEVEQAITSALENLDLAHGSNVQAFEAEFADYCGSRFAVGVGSGSAALYLALRACGIRAGDEVITVAHTFFATVEAVLLLGAEPVFVDIDPDTYTLDPAQLKMAIGPRTRAIVPVHLYGQMADMDAIMAIARRYGLIVVEDARQAHGALDHGRRAGSIGDAAAFSFNVSRNLAGHGEGGTVTTDSRAIAECVNRLRDHGSTGFYEYEEVGINSRLDDLQAAALRVKLRYLDAWNARRREHADAYAALLQGTARVRLPVVRPDAVHVYNKYVVRIRGRDRMRQALACRGVATDAPYPVPAHCQPATQGVGRRVGDLRVTHACAEEVLSLPMYPELQHAQLEYVTESVLGAEAALRRRARLGESSAPSSRSN